MDGINPTLAFAAFFFGLSGHPRDNPESPSDPLPIVQPRGPHAPSGQITPSFRFGFEKEAARHLPWQEQQAWGSINCPDFAVAVEDSPPASDIDPGIADTLHIALGTTQPSAAVGCFRYRRP